MTRFWGRISPIIRIFFQLYKPHDKLSTIEYICFMKVTDELLQNLANLSRLEFDAAEQEQIKKDLEKMIGMIGKLNELNTDDVEPLLHMTDEVNALREDEVKGSISREAALQNASLKDEQYFKVPKVIRK